MRRIALILVVPWLLALAAVPAARADDAPPALPAPDRAAIRAVIGAQIDAFRHDDGVRAFGYASPGIRAQFGNAAAFLDMVRRGYAPVYRPRAYVFGPLTRTDGQIVSTSCSPARTAWPRRRCISWSTRRTAPGASTGAC